MESSLCASIDHKSDWVGSIAATTAPGAGMALA